MIIGKSRKEIKDVLMEPQRSGVKEPYYLIQEGDQVIFVVSSGLNGSEFNKTEGFISSFLGIHIFQCLYGQGLMLLQRNDVAGEAKEFKVVTLSSGKQVELPSGWAMCLVNLGKNLLIVLGNLDMQSKELESRSIREKQGLAFYVIEKKGEIAFEQNPNYNLHPQITAE